MESTYKPTDSQMEAIKSIDGQVLVIACPGSGKTTTMLERINYMINEQSIAPKSILMIAYNKNVKEEMIKKYKKKYKAKIIPNFMTIHGLCLQIISQYYPKTLYVFDDEEEPKNIIFQIIKELKIKGQISELAEMVFSDIAKMKNNLLSVSEFINSGNINKDTFREIYNRYEEEKENRNKIDYEDMLIYANELLQNNKKARNEVRKKYQYIIVDEFQDINIVQKEIIYQLAGENGNIAVVGDDDQSIYGFRGANPSLMKSFEDEYRNCKVIKLAENFRSKEEIISLSKKLIENNKNRYKKEFKPTQGNGASIKFNSYTTREVELDRLIMGIKHDLSEGTDENKIAVLYRNNYQCNDVANLLSKENINFKTKDKIQSVFESSIFKDIVSFYNMANQKGNEDDLRRTLNKPDRNLHFKNIFKKGLDKEYMIEIINSQKFPQSHKNDLIRNLDDYFRVLERIKLYKKPEEIIGVIISDGNYYKYLENYANDYSKDYEELKNNIKYIRSFASRANTWEKFICNAEEETKKLKDAKKNKKGVTLSTIHSSKGLEWETVYIIDCIDSIYPNKDNDLEEERRLFYVGMTRAANRLVLMRYANDRNGETILSRFVKECGIIELKDSAAKEYKEEILVDTYEVEISNLEDFENYRKLIKDNHTNPDFELFDYVEDMDEPELGLGRIAKVIIDSKNLIKAMIVKYKTKNYRYQLDDIKECLVKKYLITDNTHQYNIQYNNVPKMKIGSIVEDIEDPELGFGGVNKIILNDDFTIDVVYVKYFDSTYRYDYSDNQVNSLSLVNVIYNLEEMEKYNQSIDYGEYPRIKIGDLVEDRFDANKRTGIISCIGIDDQNTIRFFNVDYNNDSRIYYGITVFENELRIIGNEKKDTIGEKKTEEDSSISSKDIERILKIRKRLIEYRKEKAKEKNIPAYLIFIDDIVDKILILNPKTKKDLEESKILSKQKINTYGDEIIRIINNNL